MPCKKVKFATEQYANDYISKLKHTSKRSVKPIRSYLCPECMVWHLTSHDDDKERQIKNLKLALEKKTKRCEILTKENHELKYKINHPMSIIDSSWKDEVTSEEKFNEITGSNYAGYSNSELLKEIDKKLSDSYTSIVERCKLLDLQQEIKSNIPKITKVSPMYPDKQKDCVCQGKQQNNIVAFRKCFYCNDCENIYFLKDEEFTQEAVNNDLKKRWSIYAKTLEIGLTLSDFVLSGSKPDQRWFTSEEWEELIKVRK